MGLVRITSWYPSFNGSHFGLPPSEIHRMTGLPPQTVWTMTYSHRAPIMARVQVSGHQKPAILRAAWSFSIILFFLSHQQWVLQSAKFRPGCTSHFQVSWGGQPDRIVVLCNTDCWCDEKKSISNEYPARTYSEMVIFNFDQQYFRCSSDLA